MAGAGGKQIIGGKEYVMYTPEWYAAKDAYRVQQAGNEGTAQGTGSGAAATTYLNALKNAGYPLLGGASGSGSGTFGANLSDFPTGMVAPPTAAPTIGAPTTPERIGGSDLPANIPHIQGPNMDAANAAEFAKAKDQVGQTARGAITGLAGAMAGRGILGSGVEGRGITNVINKGQGELGDVSRQQAINNAALQEQNALASYQGDVTQRGQNLSSLDTRRGQDVNQRGQDISAGQNAFNTLVSQRGQDNALKGLEFQGNIAQRGQNIGVRESASNNAYKQQQGLLDALSSFNRKY